MGARQGIRAPAPGGEVKQMPKADFGITVTEINDDDTEGETRWFTWDRFKTLEAAIDEVYRAYKECGADEFGVWSNDVWGVKLTVLKGKRETICHSMTIEL